MAKALLIVAGATATVAVAVGGSMSGDPIAVPGAETTPSQFRLDSDNSRSTQIAEDGTIELERRGDGHFYAEVEINGATVRALVDTGASEIALSREDAQTAGIATSIGMPNVVGQGANGEVYGEVVTLESVSLGHRTVEDMPAIVLSSGRQTLLGESFLAKFESVEIRGDTMMLR